MESKKILGAVCAIVGVIGAIFAYSTMRDDWAYSYEPPYTAHESFIIAVMVGSVILAIVGFVLLLLGQGNSGQSEKTDTNGRMDTDIVDELKKYKGLLDSGVITQEEYDEKKKQLLGL